MVNSEEWCGLQLTSGAESLRSVNARPEDAHYRAIAKALLYLSENTLAPPSLDGLASHVGISSYHLQRLFTEYVGVSPKKFSQCLSLNFAKQLLQGQRPATLLDAAAQVGLSGTGRLHDLFIQIEAMTPGEFKSGGKGLVISHSQQFTPFGEVGIASTEKGICDLSFSDAESFNQLLFAKYPNAEFKATERDSHIQAAKVISGVNQGSGNYTPLHLHLRGTPFQLKVWQLLLQIPTGACASYGALANLAGKPKAARAVGTAIGANPVAFLVPCHRVIQATGALGGYRWDAERKRVMLAWEAMGNSEVP